MGRTATRDRGAGSILRNSKGEPVAVRANLANGQGKGTLYFTKSHQPVSEEMAEREAPRLADIIRRSVPSGAGITASEWFKLYYDAAALGRVGKKTKGKPQVTVAARRARFKNYIEPLIGTTSMVDITADDLRKVVRVLDEKIHERGRFYAGEIGRTEKRNTKPGLSAKTAQNIWGEITSGFAEARSSKLDELRIVGITNQAEDVSGPNSGEDRKQAALYPNELRALLEQPLVPMYRRRLYALAAYTGLRQSECRGLRVGDIDFEHGVIVVRRQQRETKGKTTKQTKTLASKRSVPILPVLVPLLEALCEQSVDGALVKVPPGEDCAELVRKDLLVANVNREELHADDAERLHFTFHGLRHTCITHWAVAGYSMQWIMAAAGHTDWKTTQGYVDAGGAMRESFGEPHGPIPVELLGDRTEVGQTDRLGAPSGGKSLQTGDPNGNRSSANGSFDGTINQACPTEAGESGKNPDGQSALDKALAVAVELRDADLIRRVMGEIEARRIGAAGNVHSLAMERARRGR